MSSIRTIQALLAATLFLQMPLLAQARPQTSSSSTTLPQAILNARKVFISYTGEDNRDQAYSGGSDRCYAQFYTALAGWGRYDLTSTPADADLIFEIGFAVPAVGREREGILGDSAYVYDPQFRLRVVDPRTRVTLWAFTEHANWAILQSNRDKNFDQALARVFADVKGLTSAAGTSAAQK